MKILQFSGGIDSLACLLLMRDEPDLNVVTISTDGSYPERAAYLNKVKKAFPNINFHVEYTSRYLNLFGHPVDILPMRWSQIGVLTHGGGAPRYQDIYSCCNRARWIPMLEKCKELGATEIYRGTRNDDAQKIEIPHGTVVDGVSYYFPIANWTRARVLSFVREHAAELIPESYFLGEKTSRDCMDCTGYLADNQQRIKNLPIEHWKSVNQILNTWRDNVATALETGM